MRRHLHLPSACAITTLCAGACTLVPNPYHQAESDTETAGETGLADTSAEDTTESGTESSTDTETESGSDSETDTSTETGDPICGDEPCPPQNWLVTVDRPLFLGNRLIRVGLVEDELGVGQVICDALEVDAALPAAAEFVSLTFLGDRLLGITDNEVLVEIDPCACTATMISPFEGEGGANIQVLALSAEHTPEPGRLLGVSLSEGNVSVVDIDPATAQTQTTAWLGIEWGSAGLSWHLPSSQLAYVIDAKDSLMLSFTGDNNQVVDNLVLDASFDTDTGVGMTYHPDLDAVLLCGVLGSNAGLYAIDLESGAVVLGADMVVDGEDSVDCKNLAAPSRPIACISDDL
ncbi:hypothetical protein G6O69_16390 [Pseudenhygromyxa sp. WMMC2535]|uniref:hypothetical protein n=1 Tax=Pseudenhygromyxa sp. WMMC2535 TaxID=2712867 RepID=UPI00155297B0|nr:hypothetical protein [Pseudenhygromyxa sp. WMMC2535]NVB39422.1 hypothetical protein [Pseudenhygromyxa sp. WMMC2535]